MRLPLILSTYIIRNFLLAFVIALGVISLITGLIELVELIRRVSHKEFEVPFRIVMEMAIMKVPFTAEQVLPFAVLIGAMLSLSRLSKSSELIVARAAGISAWQFLTPVVLCAMLLGVFFVTVFNPISSAMISRYETLEGKYITGTPSIFSVSPSGLWLRQVQEPESSFNGQPIYEYILHARRISQDDMVMSRVIIFLFGENHQFIGRLDAPTASLMQGYWMVARPMMSAPGSLPLTMTDYHLKTDLSINQIKESFSSPKTLSFWELPGFINTLEKAGFSALRHRLHWHTLLATPFMLAAMVLIGAIFALRHHRSGRVGLMITFGILSGFLVYFISNLVYALGFSGGLPVILAAWTPSIVAIMIGTTMILHREDG